MVGKKQMSQWGVWAFLIGILLSIILAIPGVITGQLQFYALLVLGLLGIFVGLVNVTKDEVMLYLLAVVAITASAAGLYTVFNNMGAALPIVAGLTNIIVAFLGNLMAFFGVGAAIVAIKSVYEISKDQ